MGEFEGWEIPYRAELDDAAQVFDLEPGDLVYWPQYSPHRVHNHDELNVSITTNHTTALSYRRNAVYRMNGLCRRRFKRAARSTEIEGLVPSLKVAASTAIRSVELYSVTQYEPVISFRVDPDAPLGFVDRCP